MKKHIQRETYLKTLRKLKDIDLIKVITGVRRAGKSVLMDDFRAELLKSTPAARIQKYNFEDPAVAETKTWLEIYELINSKLVKGKKNYIFLDEVQTIPEFERLLDGLYTNKDIDLYVTGSNAFLLSSDLATLLTGRAFPINVLPFSFKEFVELFDGSRSTESLFADYLSYSSMPEAAILLSIDPELALKYAGEVYHSIFENDIKPRISPNPERAFHNVSDFAFDNIGNQFSPNRVASILTSENKKIDARTVEKYLDALSDSYVLYKASRYDIKGKQHLATQGKYYVSDLGFRNALLGKEVGEDRGHLLENIIFLELLRRGNRVWIGKIDDKEVDFIARDSAGFTTYYQVAFTVRDNETLKRELAPFEKIPDHNLKILLTLDTEEMTHNGVRQINAIKFLLEER